MIKLLCCSTGTLVRGPDFIQVRIIRGESCGCLHVRACCRIPHHRFEGFCAGPLRIVHDAGAIDTLMEVRGHKARLLRHHLVCRVHQEIEELLLVLGSNSKDVDERYDIGLLGSPFKVLPNCLSDS